MVEGRLKGGPLPAADTHEHLSLGVELEDLVVVPVDEEYVVVGGDKDAVGVEQDAGPPAGEEVTVGVEDQHRRVLALEGVDTVLGVGGNVAYVAVGPALR